MPELPEVENARATLQRYLAGRVLSRIRAEAARPIRGSVPTLRRKLMGAKVGRAQRLGKQAFLPLTGRGGDRFGLALHFGMTGRIAVVPPGSPAPRYSRLSLTRESDGLSLHFCDVRRFGRVALVEARRISELPEASALGPDPILDPWTPAILRGALLGTERPVKDVLMDQRRIAGIGNIYAVESLWRARVHPLRPAASLTSTEHARLARSVTAVLEGSLELFRSQRESSAARWRLGDPDAFTEAIYLSEGAGNPFEVYAREAESCSRCSTPIESVTIAGRSSFYCPACQR